jgi:(2Fe-2S) ferredoxin
VAEAKRSGATGGAEPVRAGEAAASAAAASAAAVGETMGRIFERHVFVCTSGDFCPAVDGDGLGVHARLKKAVGEAGLGGRVRVNKSGCLDQCGHGPMVVVYPDAVWYWGVRPEDAEEIVREHLIGGRPVERLVYRNRPGKNKLPRDEQNRPIGRPRRAATGAGEAGEP